MTHINETRRVGDAAGLGELSSVGTGDDPKIPPTHEVAQAKNRPSAAVAAALKRSKQRQRDRLLDIKRGSLWTVAITARGWIDSLLWALEEPEYDAIFDSAKPFIEHARAIAKLVNDFESERQSSAPRQGEMQP
jgi:hypothetical protein